MSLARKLTDKEKADILEGVKSLLSREEVELPTQDGFIVLHMEMPDKSQRVHPTLFDKIREDDNI